MSTETVTTDPRVWFDGDDVPAGVWTYRVEMEARDPSDAIEMLGEDGEPCGNGNLGPLVEIVIPADLDGVIARAAAARGLLCCNGCREMLGESDVGSRSGPVVACQACTDDAEPQEVDRG